MTHEQHTQDRSKVHTPGDVQCSGELKANEQSSTEPRPVRCSGPAAHSSPLSLALGILAFLVVATMSIACEPPIEDLRPPPVPGPPRVERVDIDRFRLYWQPSPDDVTPIERIIYEIGVLGEEVCVVTESTTIVRGQTQIELDLSGLDGLSPLIGFSVRAIDEVGQSRGYGACSWIAREPQRVPVSWSGRYPNIAAAADSGPSLTCRSDGDRGVWCAGERSLSHLESHLWNEFPVPGNLGPDDWLPLDRFSALVRAQSTQLSLSRAVGTQAMLISADSEPFTGSRGAISTGRARAFLAVRDLLGEYSLQHIDFKGPPSALRLPDSCVEVVQMGRVTREIGFAVCSTEGPHRLFVGEINRPRVDWRTSYNLEGDWIDDISGTLSDLLVAVTSDQTGWLERIQPDDRIRIEIPESLRGRRPRLGISDDEGYVFGVVGVGDDTAVYNGTQWMQLGSDPILRWGGVAFERRSHFVGTPTGIWAIGTSRASELHRNGGDELVTGVRSLTGVRGQDNRLYLYGDDPVEVIQSSRDGDDWYAHAWSGSPISIHDLAVAAGGSLYTSGILYEDGADVGRAAIVLLGMAGSDEIPLPETAYQEPLPIGVDRRGRLYVGTPDGLRWQSTAFRNWSDPIPLDDGIVDVVGLDAAVAVATRQGDRATGLHLCDGGACEPVDIQAFGASGEISHLVRTRDGFCAVMAPTGLLCIDSEGPHWVAVTLSEQQSERFGVTDEDAWSIADVTQTDLGEWLLALDTPLGGVLARVQNEAGPSAVRTIADEIEWATGAVLLATDRAPGEVFLIERRGPTTVNYAGRGPTERRILYQ